MEINNIMFRCENVFLKVAQVNLKKLAIMSETIG